MKALVTPQSLMFFALYFGSGLGLLWAFTVAYSWMTPYDDYQEIEKGTLAPAISLVGAMIGFTIPIVTVSYLGINYFEFLLWSMISGTIQMIVFKLMYHHLPGEIEKNNCAAATLFAGAAVCVGILNAFALIP